MHTMKTVNKSYKYRFYPTHDQKVQLSHSFGCSRFVYNHLLQQKSEAYKEKKERINFSTTSRLLTKLKQDENFAWLNDVSSVILQQSLRDLDKAFTNFFSGRARYPQIFKV